MERTCSEKWAASVQRWVKLRSFTVELVLCGLGFLSPTFQLVGHFRAGQLTLVDFVGAE